MCIFNKPVKEVSGTRIFVTQTCDGRQFTCYQNYVKFPDTEGESNRFKASVAAAKKKAEATKPKNENAMILPFPIRADSKLKEPIELIDLSKCADLIEKMDKAFPELKWRSNVKSRSRFAGSSQSEGKLAVVKVGSYDCSVAKNLGDLRKIDETVFKVSSNVDEVLGKHYSSGFGFLICKLRAEGKQHPIAYITETAKDGEMFVPTRHEHGDKEEKKPHWDHYIFSSNTTDSKVAGATAAEMTAILTAEAKTKNKKDGVGAGEWVVNEATLQPNTILSALRVPVVHPNEFRRLRIEGKTLDNQDLIFKFKTSTDKLKS
jgi:hypothetical protein